MIYENLRFILAKTVYNSINYYRTKGTDNHTYLYVIIYLYRLMCKAQYTI